MSVQHIENFIANALKEDVGDGDHTSKACISENAVSKAKLIIKEEGIIAGVELAEMIFKIIDKEITLNVFIKDGTHVRKGDIAFEVNGNSQNILKAERLVLNCMQRMSGIATTTNRIVKLLDGFKTKILDTRKTTPNFRMIEKWAVRIGGGENHRMGLYDMILIKDNHVDCAGGIENAIKNTCEYLKIKNKNLKIEIEVRNFDELKKVLDVGKVDRILLDNFSVSDLKKAVELVDGRFETEASGGVREDNIRKIAETGVDYISVGALTHQIKSLDMSLKILDLVI